MFFSFLLSSQSSSKSNPIHNPCIHDKIFHNSFIIKMISWKWYQTTYTFQCSPKKNTETYMRKVTISWNTLKIRVMRENKLEMTLKRNRWWNILYIPPFIGQKSINNTFYLVYRIIYVTFLILKIIWSVTIYLHSNRSTCSWMEWTWKEVLSKIYLSL